MYITILGPKENVCYYSLRKQTNTCTYFQTYILIFNLTYIPLKNKDSCVYNFYKTLLGQKLNVCELIKNNKIIVNVHIIHSV